MGRTAFDLVSSAVGTVAVIAQMLPHLEKYPGQEVLTGRSSSGNSRTGPEGCPDEGRAAAADGSCSCTVEELR